MAIKIVNQQIEAYNNRDIVSMMGVFSEDIQIVDFDDNHIILNGIGECKKMYAELFNSSPDLNAEVVNTTAFNNKIIVHEFISGRNGNKERLEQVIIFEVKKNKITRIKIIRNNP